MKIEVNTEFNIGDIVYEYDCNKNVTKELIIRDIAYYMYNNKIPYLLYTDTNGNYHREHTLFKTKEECEKNFVLNNFGHLFKDTKTLK